MFKAIKYCSVIFITSFYGGMAFSQENVDEECRETKRISCVDLAIGISSVDTTLQNGGTTFDDLGDLLEQLKQESEFGPINTLLVNAVDISFDNVDEFFGAVIKCDLVAQVIAEIED